MGEIGPGPDILSHSPNIQGEELAPPPPNTIRYGNSDIPAKTGLREVIVQMYGIGSHNIDLSGQNPQEANSPEPAHGVLTPTQLLVLSEIGKGKTVKETAIDLNKSFLTVRNLLVKARERLGATLNEEAVVSAMNTGEIEPLSVIPKDFRISRIANLTPTEKSAYSALVEREGYETFAQVAISLGMAKQTLKNHAKNIWRKLCLRDRAQAVIVHRAVQLSELEFLLSLEDGAEGDNGGGLLL